MPPVDADAIKAMTSAYAHLRTTLGLVEEGTDPLTEAVATKLIELVQRGVCDPIALCELVLKELCQ
jgi:hypothetical protein